MEFQYSLPVNLLFGRGKVGEVGKEAVNYGKKALIVTGGSSSKRSELLDRIRERLEAQKIGNFVFDEVTPNPLTTTAEKAAKYAKAYNCDMVIAIGGGSVIDCAMAAALLAENTGDVNDYIYNRLQGKGALPLIAIPTTCGTGSEGNGFGVLTNPENHDKKSLRRREIVPKLSIIDSELMETMPRTLLASVTFDALCHCMEAFLSNSCDPLTETLAYRGIKMISDTLVNVYNGYNDSEAWDSLALASTFGGMVIHSAGVTLPHAMEHPVSGLKNVTHGKGLAALTPVITEASCTFAPEKYETISKLLRGNSAIDCADALRRLLERIGLSATLSGEGITEEDIPWLSENCFKVSAASIKNHPAVFDSDMIRKLYKRAI